jgi:hypothetical protein
MQQNLPKSTQRQLVWETLKYHQKLSFWFFLLIFKIPCVDSGRGGMKACAYCLDFHSKISPMPILLSKNGLVSESLCAKWHFSQDFICDMRFCGHVLNSHGNKNFESIDPYLIYKNDKSSFQKGRETFVIILGIFWTVYADLI